MPKGKKRDTTGLKVTRKPETYNSYAANKTIPNAKRITEYLFSVTGDNTIERTNYLIETEWLTDVPADVYSSGVVYEEAHAKGDFSYDRRTETKQKFLCVGGPLAGQRVTSAPGYSEYNRASRGADANYRVVFVYDALLKESK